jgi:hypothetical protein
MAGIGPNPDSPNFQASLARQGRLNREMAPLDPQQVAEQQGLQNLEQLASVFGLSPNVSASGSLAARSGLSFGAPPTPAPFPRSGWSPASQGK